VSSAAIGEADPYPIRLTIPAEPRLLRLARMTAATIAVDLGFSLQDIEDVRVAVDELAAALIEGHEPDAVLELAFGSDQGSVLVTGEVVGGAGRTPELHAVARELLDLVADEYAVERGPTGRASFRLTKHRGSASE
jgi:serine/threonine-protein kinase RsbW